jgi:predicted Zn-dependent protease
LAVPEDTSKGVLTTVDLTRQIIGLRYSRDDEREGDISGMDYMVRAGYDPYGMVETMEMLERQEKARGIEFLSTHPSPENRVSYLRNNIELRYPDTSLLRIGREDYSRNVLSRLR